MKEKPCHEPQKIIVVGATGKVGTELVKQIGEKDRKEQGHIHPTEIAMIANSGYFKILTSENADRLHPKKMREWLEQEGAPYDGTPKALEEIIGNEKRLNNAIVVDATDLKRQPVIEFHRSLLKRGLSIVTANKNPLALSTHEEFRALTDDRSKYKYGSTVMSGGGVIEWLQSLVDLNENVQWIRGCLSGTLGYLTSELEKGKKFSDILSAAKKAGYTEPHPWNDLNGLDVARKAVIIARSLNIPVSMDEITMQPMIDPKYGDIDGADDFLKAVEDEDKAMAAQMQTALNRGNTLRYMAEVARKDSKYQVKVGLTEVPLSSLAGQLQGTANLFECMAETSTAEHPHQIISEGAGLKRTAFSIRLDLRNLLPHCVYST